MNLFYRLGDFYSSIFAKTNTQINNKTGTQFIYDIESKTPIWLDTGDSWKLFREIPHLNAVLDRKAELVSQAKLTIEDLDGNLVENNETNQILNLFNKPNPLQSKSEFLYQYSINKNLIGNAFIYKLKAFDSQDIPDVMWVIPSDTMQINTTGKWLNQHRLEDIIKDYTIIPTNETLTTDQIIFKNQGNTSSSITGESPLLSLNKAITNISYALGYVNVVYGKKGAVGILSSDVGGSNGIGAIPLGDKERERIQKDYISKYGVSDNQMSVIMSQASLKWTPMSYPLGQLEIGEEIERDFGVICDRFGVDRDMFSSTKGATFENKKQGEIKTITGAVKQEIDDLMLSFSEDFGLMDKGLQIKASYSHLPVMQEDEKEKAEVLKSKVDSYNTLYSNDVITLEQYKDLISKDLKI